MRAPRLEVAKLSREGLERLQAQAVRFVEESSVLRELLEDVQLARGRLYFRRGAENLMARLTPLGPRTMVFEAPHGSSWTEMRRGQLAIVLKVLEGDTEGTFHGLGSLTQTHRGGKPPTHVALHREIGIPPRVLADPRYWYSMHRKPVIAAVGSFLRLLGRSLHFGRRSRGGGSLRGRSV
ncbi:MAG: hypothetical protein HYX75_20165 [Acidobacteria bacterium]|nr:hypothetical protein [Acidobacteriota bacterium]